MKTLKYFIFTMLVGSLLSSCGAASQPAPTPFAESMKGYELYSWQDGNQWNFSLLVGTNREKTLDEIRDAKTVLHGVDALTSALQQIPAGQYITWCSRETLSFPSDDIIKEVKQSCEDKGLILNIAL